MSESTNQQRTNEGRRDLRVVVYGDTADELELAALDKGRAFFGSDVRLQLDRTYKVFDPAFPEKAGGKSYSSAITVYTIPTDA